MNWVSYAEAGPFEEAKALFQNRFSPRVNSLVQRGDPASVALAYPPALDLPGFDRQSRAARLKTVNAGGATGAWAETIRCLIELESGDSAAAQKTLESVILLPDRNLAHHHSRLIRGFKL
jgi:hypothetical protein